MRYFHLMASFLFLSTPLVATTLLANSEPIHEDRLVEKMRAPIGKLQAELMAELQQALGEKGAEGAIDVCRVRAPEIAQEVQTDTIQIGRSSHRVRNPKNEPEDWMKPVMKKWKEKSGQELEGEFHLQRLSSESGEGRWAYAQPIVLQPLCAQCHGTNLDPDLQKTIQESYPEDEATGFEVNAFRGIFWAEMEDE